LLELQQFGCPVVDVREPEEFETARGAVNIRVACSSSRWTGIRRTEAEAHHRQRPVVLYCLSGGRSALAAEALLRMGFVDPMSLADGILGWADAGHPVVTPAWRTTVAATAASPRC
jgi:rhodanese-related sulfurtransferase